jgi:hypothetical protein
MACVGLGGCEAEMALKLVGSGLRTMLNTSAGAGHLEATPKVGGYGYGSAQPCRRSRPGASAGDCDAWRPRPRRVGLAACRVADGRADSRANIRLRGQGCIRCKEGCWWPGGTRGAASDGEVRRLPRSCGAGRAPLAGSGDDAPDASGCIGMPAGAMMMRAAQRNQLHHRCIRSRRAVKSQVTEAAPSGPGAGVPQGRTLRRRQRMFTRTAECCI